MDQKRPHQYALEEVGSVLSQTVCSGTFAVGTWSDLDVIQLQGVLCKVKQNSSCSRMCINEQNQQLLAAHQRINQDPVWTSNEVRSLFDIRADKTFFLYLNSG